MCNGVFILKNIRYLFIYIYIIRLNTHTCRHTYIYRYRNIDFEINTHTCMHANIHIHLLTYLPTYLPTNIHYIHMQYVSAKCIRVNRKDTQHTYACAQTYIHTYGCMHNFVYSYMHVIHRCSLKEQKFMHTDRNAHKHAYHKCIHRRVAHRSGGTRITKK